MKKITFWLFALFTCMQINAQVSSYSFTAGTAGVLDPMASSTQLVASASDDGVSAVTNIGFTFNYAGTDYTQFSVNSNGLVRLGATAVTSQWTNTTANVALTLPAIMPYWDDLATGSAVGGGKVHYVLTGTAPNRKLIIEWFVTIPRATTGPANAKFQCVLNETSNVIEIVYGTGMVVNTPTTGATIGLATSATVFNTVDVVTNTNSNATFKLDNTAAITSGTVYTFTPPTCPSSTGMTASNITNSSATVTWIAPTPTAPSAGYEYVISTSATAPTANGTATTDLFASVSGLLSNTTYYVFVRSNCGSEFGSWIAVGTFKTQCDSVTEFIETFDSTATGVGNLPACWSKAGTSANVYNTTGSVAPMSPSNRLYMNISATTSAFALMPPVSNLQAETHRLKFKAYATAASKKLRVGYFTNPADVSTYVFFEEIDMPSTAATATEFTIVPYTIPVGVTSLVFSLPAGTTTTVYIDDVKWEENSTCLEPTALNASLITNSNAQLSWVNGATEAEWQVQYGITGFTLGTGTIVTGVMTNPYVLGSLTSNTTYQYYVRGVCSGPTYSSWSGPFTFKTLCDDVTEFSENFDSYTSGVNSLPNCWSRGGSSITTYITTGAAAPMSPANRLYMFASGTTPTEGYAIMPPVSNLAANTHRLKFRAYATTNPRDLIVGYLTDPSDVSTFVTLQTLSVPGTLLANTQQFVVTPGALPAGVKCLAFKNPGFTSSTATFYIDDVVWEPIPSTAPVCVTDLTATPNATCGNYPTTLSWTPSANTDGHYLSIGTTPGGSDILSNSNIGIVSTYSFTGTFNTTYYYTLVPFNAIGSATGCVEQSFSTFVSGCYCSAAPTSVDGTGITNVQVATTSFPNTVSTSPVYNNHTTTVVDMLQGLTNNLMISFSTLTYDYNTVVWIDFNNDYNFDASEIVYTGLSSATSPNVLNASFLLSATAPLGNHRMRIVATDVLQNPSNSCYSGSYGEIADFTINVIVPPSCLSPTSATASAITDSTATVTWSGSTATNYEVVVQTAGTGTPALANNTGVNVAAMTYNASGLSSNTTYEYYVRAECTLDTELGSWSGPFTFTTLCSPYTIPYTEGFETGYTNNVAVAGCLSQSTTTGTSSWTANNTLTTYNRAPRTGAWNAFLQYGNEDWLYIPVTLVGGTSYTASVYARQDGAVATNSNVGLSYGSINTSVGMSNVIVAPTGIINGDYQLITGNFTPATSGVYYVGIKGYMNGTPWYISLDDLSIVETPVCPAPTGDAAQTVCGNGTLADLVVTGSSIVWHDAVTAGSVLPSSTSIVTGTTYYASQDLATCINGDRLAITATVTPQLTPAFNPIAAICSGSTAPTLPLTSTNGVTGTWSPAAVSNTATATYTFTPDSGQCVTTTPVTLDVTVNSLPATPTGDAAQTFCPADSGVLADLAVTGTNLVWYDAATGGNVLPNTTTISATTYYVASNNGTCDSQRLAITTAEDCPVAPCLTSVNGQWPGTTFVPNSANCDGYTLQSITTCGYASEYSVVTVVSGETYTFASYTAGVINSDVITISADAGLTAVATGIGSVTWVATVSGDIRFYTHLDGCAAESVCRTRTVTCGAITTDAPDYVSLQWPPTITIPQGGNGTVYGQVYEGGLTDIVPNIDGQAPGITAWVGISPIGSNTNPSTWTNWIPATWNSAHISNNDEYQATIGTTLLPGTYYYATRFRLNSGAYVYGGIDSSNNGNFWNGTTYNSGVLTVTPPPAPANDNCAGAYSVTVNPDLTCTSVTTGTLVGATASTTDTAACGGTEDDDVWFSFVATATTHQISLNNITGSTTDLYHSLWTGADCASLTLVPGTCSDPNTSTPVGLTIGTTYYIRVYSWTSIAGQTSAFNVCVGTLPPPPANDDCTNAISVLTMPYTNTQDATAATNNAGFINSCSNTMNDGVWYSVVGNGNDIIINLSGVGNWDPQVDVYTGSCGSFICVGSADVGGTAGAETFTISASSIGTTYFINVGNYSGFTNNPEGLFTIGLTETLGNGSFDSSNFTFYPNPVKDVLNLSYSQNINKVQVINILGQEVKTVSMDATQAQVDMSNLPTGTYLVKVTSDNQVKTIKVIKQ